MISTTWHSIGLLTFILALAACSSNGVESASSCDAGATCGDGGRSGGANGGASGTGTTGGTGGVNAVAGSGGTTTAPGSGGATTSVDASTGGSAPDGSIACPADQIGTPPDCVSAPPVPPGPGMHWSLAFSEEFDGTDYDHTKLSPCFDWNYGGCTSSFNKGREHYDPGQIQVSNGTAKLTAEPLDPPLSSTACYQDECTYKSGMLSTCRPNAGDGSDYLYKFTYGYVEARMKFPGTQGFFTAFWMLPADPSYSYRSEIDIVEILGDDPTTIFMTYHYNDRTQSHAVNQGKYDNGNCEVKDYSTDFHTFGMDWEADHVAWYIDGVQCDEFTGSTAEIESGPMQIILDLMVDHQWQQDWGVMLQDTSLVRAIDLDYLRVYQQLP